MRGAGAGTDPLIRWYPAAEFVTKDAASYNDIVEKDIAFIFTLILTLDSTNLTVLQLREMKVSQGTKIPQICSLQGSR